MKLEFKDKIISNRIIFCLIIFLPPVGLICYALFKAKDFFIKLLCLIVSLLIITFLIYNIFLLHENDNQLMRTKQNEEVMFSQYEDRFFEDDIVFVSASKNIFHSNINCSALDNADEIDNYKLGDLLNLKNQLRVKNVIKN